MGPPELVAKYRAELFSALLDQYSQQDGWDKVFQLLNQGQKAARAAQMPALEQQMAGGKDLVLQGLRDTGKFIDWELAIIEVGLATGNISESYSRLRDHYRLQEAFALELKRQCQWPLAMAIIVMLTMYGWLLAMQLLSLTTAAIGSLVTSALLVAVVSVLARFTSITLAGTASNGSRAVMRKLPGLGRVVRSQQILHFFTGLKQSVSAQLPLTESLKLAADHLPDRFYQPECLAVYTSVAGGGKLSAALSASGLLKGVTIPALSLRQAGASEAMTHITEAVYAHHLEQLWQLAKWLPQVLFALLPLLAVIQVWVL